VRKLPLAVAIGFACLLFSQEKVDEATDARIRSEELEHSQLMRTLHVLADWYGPRVTGTPNHEAAAK
jgi:carboxypeptidase Q